MRAGRRRRSCQSTAHGVATANENLRSPGDILCLANAITHGHAPLGVAITTAAIADAIELDVYSTFGWHPVAVEAALREHGLLVAAEDDRISLFAALTVDEGTLEEGLDVLLRSL